MLLPDQKNPSKLLRPKNVNKVHWQKGVAATLLSARKYPDFQTPVAREFPSEQQLGR